MHKFPFYDLCALKYCKLYINMHFVRNDFAGGTFSIRRTEGTCAEDCGYLAVVDSDTSEASCDWESKFGHPRFLYSRLTDSCGHYEDPGKYCLT